MSTSRKSREASMFLLLGCALTVVGGVLLSGNVVFAADVSKLEGKVASIKKDMLDLGKDIKIFERVAVFPDDRRVSFFLTLDVGEFFSLSRVKLKIDDEWVAAKEFQKNESSGLEKGAAIRVYVGNVEEGRHKVLAFFEGVGPRARPYKRAIKHAFLKQKEPVFFEMRINDSVQRLQPEFLIKQW